MLRRQLFVLATPSGYAALGSKPAADGRWRSVPMSSDSFAEMLFEGIGEWHAMLRRANPAAAASIPDDVDAILQQSRARLITAGDVATASTSGGGAPRQGRHHRARRLSPELAIEYAPPDIGGVGRGPRPTRIGILDVPPLLPIPLVLLRDHETVPLRELLEFITSHTEVGFVVGSGVGLRAGVVTRERTFPFGLFEVDAIPGPDGAHALSPKDQSRVRALLSGAVASDAELDKHDAGSSDDEALVGVREGLRSVPVVWHRLTPDVQAAVGCSLDGNPLFPHFAGLSRNAVKNIKALSDAELLVRDMRHGELRYWDSSGQM
jgi:hypothetical protein